MLSVIHSLLDSEVTRFSFFKVNIYIYITKFTFIFDAFSHQPFVNAEVFTQFTEQLVTQSPLFTKSMKFAKMMLTALTKYGNLVRHFSLLISKVEKKLSF